MISICLLLRSRISFDLILLDIGELDLGVLISWISREDSFLHVKRLPMFLGSFSFYLLLIYDCYFPIFNAFLAC